MDDVFQASSAGLLIAGVYGNDVEPDAGQTKFYTLGSGPQHGTLSYFNSGGSFSYTADAGFDGEDTFHLSALRRA